MKIGILTLPLHTNYGGILQAYALQTVLERMGHEVYVINKDRSPRQFTLFEVFVSFFKIIVSSIVHCRIYPYYNIRKKSKNTYNIYLIKSKYTRIFVDKYINEFVISDYSRDLRSSHFDAIVVGSDQIWSHIHAGSIGGVINAFLPSLSEKVLRLSYAASFGKDIWEYSDFETNVAKVAVRNFRGISVREISAIDMCKKYLNCEAIQHLDPTMLLTKEDYISSLNISGIKPSPGNMLVYIIDSSCEKLKIVDYVENVLSLHRFVVNSKAEDNNSKNTKLEDCIQPPVEKWIRGFMDADFIVTDSFHACVFSILFQKQFIAIGNVERGLARFQSLFEMFEIKNRIVSSLEDAQNIDLSENIEYHIVKLKLNAERAKSMTYLNQMLS